MNFVDPSQNSLTGLFPIHFVFGSTATSTNKEANTSLFVKANWLSSWQMFFVTLLCFHLIHISPSSNSSLCHIQQATLLWASGLNWDIFVNLGSKLLFVLVISVSFGVFDNSEKDKETHFCHAGLPLGCFLSKKLLEWCVWSELQLGKFSLLTWLPQNQLLFVNTDMLADGVSSGVSVSLFFMTCLCSCTWFARQIQFSPNIEFTNPSICFFLCSLQLLHCWFWKIDRVKRIKHGHEVKTTAGEKLWQMMQKPFSVKWLQKEKES